MKQTHNLQAALHSEPSSFVINISSESHTLNSALLWHQWGFSNPVVVHEKNNSSNIFSLCFHSLVSLVSQRCPILKRSRTFHCHLPIFMPSLGICSYELRQADQRLDLFYSFTSSLTQFGRSASHSKEIDSSTCRGSKKSKKR